MIIWALSSFQLSIFRKDRTKTGHALGEPGSRPTNAEPQRDMPPIVCSLLRIIMHSAMVMGASRNPQVISLFAISCSPSEPLWRMNFDLERQCFNVVLIKERSIRFTWCLVWLISFQIDRKSQIKMIIMMEIATIKIVLRLYLQRLYKAQPRSLTRGSREQIQWVSVWRAWTRNYQITSSVSDWK